MPRTNDMESFMTIQKIAEFLKERDEALEPGEATDIERQESAKIIAALSAQPDAGSGGDERTQFEAWRKTLMARPNLMRNGELDYEDYDTQLAWSGWQAALAALRPAYVQGSDELRARTDGERAAYMEGLEEGKRIAARQPVGVSDSDLHLAAQMLTWGRDEGLTTQQEREIEAHQKKLFDALGAGAPPAPAAVPDDGIAYLDLMVEKAGFPPDIPEMSGDEFPGDRLFPDQTEAWAAGWNSCRDLAITLACQAQHAATHPQPAVAASAGHIVVPIDPADLSGMPEYQAGNWSRREWDAAMRDFVGAQIQPAAANGVPELFVQWLEREMPAGTIIGKPAWWAPKLARALRSAERGVLGGCNG